MARAAFLAALALAAVFAPAQTPDSSASASLSYSRSFKGSDPSFFKVVIARDGAADFTAREHDNDPPMTLRFEASPATVRRLFAEAAALDDFSGRKIQSTADVAYTGTKILTYDAGAAHGQQQFTYTRERNAAQLVSTFEKIGITGMDAIRLARAMRYDRLDVLQNMEQIQSDWDSHSLAESQLLAPTLAELAGDSNQMDAARHRAEKLLAAMHLDGAAKSR